MAIYPTVTETYQSQTVTDTFGMYNHNLKIGAGEFYDTKNLTADEYPMLCVRKPRGKIASLSAPNGISARAKLAYVDGSSLVYGGLDITGYLTDRGLALSPSSEKQLVSMGAYLVIFPDKLYINTENFSDCGAMEASSVTAGDVEYSLCQEDGTGYGSPTVSGSEPQSPADGALWIDTSGNTHGLKIFSAATGMWVSVATVYTKISAPGIGLPFSQYDGVEISGCSGTAQVEALNGSKLIFDRSDNHIVVVGLLDQVYTQTEGQVTVKREVPSMDFVVECQNRLWGCKYGQVDGKTVNEIYCCALGDFKNWRKYQGIATDSYAASVGSDGQWTGAVNYLGNPIFFKENVAHRVYVSAGGAHQITATNMRGVLKGSEKSLCVVGNLLYYLSRDGVCSYDGSMPSVISQKLGSVRYEAGVAGSLGSKLYISMKDSAGNYSLFCCDTEKGLWIREDSTQAVGFASMPEDTYMLTAGNEIWSLNGTSGEPETGMDWQAQSGLIGYQQMGQKYVSRINIRMVLPAGATASLLMQYDEDPQWYPGGTAVGRNSASFCFPVRPRRCDHFRYALRGTGDCKIFSVSMVLEEGSDVSRVEMLDF